ncbi:hypothetical protein LP416_30315 [Polaromonas sp. P2-4]|nr:hypothetical protein LP416_30315 [Polaromonas sp. P2-4]
MAVPVPVLQVAVTLPTKGVPVAAVPFTVKADPLPPPPPQAVSNALPPRTKQAKESLVIRIFIPLLQVYKKYRIDTSEFMLADLPKQCHRPTLQIN